MIKKEPDPAREFIKAQTVIIKFLEEVKLKRKNAKKEKIMGVINTIVDLYKMLEGKKTLIVAFLIALFALLTAFGVVIPEWVYLLTSALGLGALRVAKK